LSTLGVDIFVRSVITGSLVLFGMGWMYLYHWIVGLIHRNVTTPNGVSGQNAAGTES
jgi:hypothetical protein